MTALKILENLFLIINIENIEKLVLLFSIPKIL